MQADETAAWEAEKEAENQRLKRHQRVLDKQSRALLKLPNRKERSEVSLQQPQYQMRTLEVYSDMHTMSMQKPFPACMLCTSFASLPFALPSPPTKLSLAVVCCFLFAVSSSGWLRWLCFWKHELLLSADIYLRWKL